MATQDMLSGAGRLWDIFGNDVLIFVLGAMFNILFFRSDNFLGWIVPKRSRHAAKAKQVSARSVPSASEDKRVKPSQPHDVPESIARQAWKQRQDSARTELLESLRSLHKGMHQSEVSRVLAAAMEQCHEYDESLINIFVETCIRLGRTDVLRRWLQKNSGVASKIRREHTFCSIIRAQGAIGDIDGAWHTWKALRVCHLTMSCVTLGCMVAALVDKGDPEAAYALVREIRGDEGNSRRVVNSVTYGTVIKGFAHQKKFNRVWAVYQEMTALESDFTVVTFNTLIDACARCEQTQRIPALLQDMERLQVEPDIRTYGAALKGYCTEGSIDKSCELLESMRAKTDFKLDEMMYNSLLDGCARNGQWLRAIAVLQEMEDGGTTPSNFTMSVLVKAGRRSRCDIDELFDVVYGSAKKHGIRFNVHVYTNLVHACCDRKDWSRALSVFGDMVKSHVQPDLRTYTVLLNSLAMSGETGMVDGMIRAALGIRGATPQLVAYADGNLSRLRPQVPLPAQLISDLLASVMKRGEQGRNTVAQLLADMNHLNLRIDPKVKLRFAADLAKLQSRS